ncbi:MAG: efflux RND transporter periplasmic adaptor subunit [Patescibacteria group bacterium]
MKKKKIILIIVILIAVIFVISKVFVKNEDTSFAPEKVTRGTVIQEVSETGIVKKGEEINLSFQNGGKIEKIYAEAGSAVKSGDILAKIDIGQLNIQYAEARAALDVAKAKLQVARTSVSNYQTALSAKKQNLIDVTAAARQSLEAAYEDAQNTLDDAYLKTYNALDVVKTIQISYFYRGDQESIAVADGKKSIDNSLAEAKSSLDAVLADSKDKNIDTALSVMKKSLEEAASGLTIVRQNCDMSVYRDIVSSSHKTSLDTQRTNINTALTNIVNSQQAISLAKVTNDANINAAKNDVLTAEGSLKKSEDDIVLYQAQVKQSEAQANLLWQKISDTSISAPTDGQITKVNKKAGEIVQSSESVISFLSSGPFQVAADIYEEDIVKVKVGDPADIKATAFSGQIFFGKVIFINPAEKLVDGVVYYEVKIDFQEAPQEIKPGMTADITIKTAQKDNVLVVSESAVTKKDNKNFVQVIKDEKQQEREVQVGLKGSEGIVEIVSGLKEGEEIAVPR